jgi:hypothetical protein
METRRNSSGLRFEGRIELVPSLMLRGEFGGNLRERPPRFNQNNRLI